MKHSWQKLVVTTGEVKISSDDILDMPKLYETGKKQK